MYLSKPKKTGIQFLLFSLTAEDAGLRTSESNSSFCGDCLSVSSIDERDML